MPAEPKPTKYERKAEALPAKLTGGDIFPYLVCPLCGRNRSFKSKKGFARWDYVDLLKAPFVMHRRQHSREPGGYCKGFVRIKGGDLTVADIIASHPEWIDTLRAMKEQILRIVKVLVGFGIIRRDELKEI